MRIAPFTSGMAMADRKTSADRDTERKSDLLTLAKKRWQIADAAESEQREKALEDIRFAEGDQWPEEILEMRRRQNRPCLTINRIPQFVQHITNEQRANPIAIQVNPVGDGDKETAEVIEGVIRHVEDQSNADEAYSNGFDYAVKGGYGFWRVTTDYADEFSFDQEIYIRKVENPFDVRLDPGAQEGDGSDADYGFVRGWYTKEAFEAAYPSLDYSDTHSWTQEGNYGDREDGIAVVEYFYKEIRDIKIVQTSDGQVYMDKTLPRMADGSYKLPKGINIVQMRKTQVPFVKRALLTNDEVLDEQEWAGKWIPIVKVIGQMTNINGKRIYKGIVRDARDPQQQLNLMESAATEAIAITPKAPYLVTPASIKGFEKPWATMNTQNRPFLYYNPDREAANGGLPTRNQIEPPIQAMMLAVRQASDDLKSTAGIYDAALGAGSNDVSGKAILARQQQSNISAFHFADNLKRSIRQTGRILVDLIPFIYNTTRIVRIIGEDGTQQNVQIAPGAAQQPQQPGVQQVFDLTVGKYDVTISTGPSYQTKRQEAVETQLELMKTVPNAAPIIADLVVRNMDIPNADKIADRLETLLPPAVSALEMQGANLPPEAMQKIAQLQAQLQQAQQGAQQAATDLKYSLSSKQMETQSREKIEYAKIEASIVVAEVAAKAQMAQSDAQRELTWLQQQVGQAHEAAMAAQDHANAQEMQQQAAEQPQAPQEGQQ